MSASSSSKSVRTSSSETSKRSKGAAKSSTGKAPGYLARHSAAQKAGREAREATSCDSQDLERWLQERGGPVHSEDVVRLTKATETFLVDPEQPAGVVFQRIRVTVGEADGEVLFDQSLQQPEGAGDEFAPSAGAVSYELPASCLGVICTAYIEFKAKVEVKNFHMVERFFFGNTLLKDLRFDFGFCIPGSVNTVAITYDTPPISDDLREKILANPKGVQADSFYFNDDVLFMHHKSDYAYY